MRFFLNDYNYIWKELICTHRIILVLLTTTMVLVGITKPIIVGESESIEPTITEPIIIEEIEPIETTELDQSVEVKETTTERVVESTTVSKEKEQVTFRVTAYCSCSKCCGKYASNRPLDENGKEIVYGASNKRLTPGVSCASPLPFGTKVKVDGYGTVIVEDRTAQWVVDKYGRYIIDIYFDDHQVASNFGCRYMKGVVM